MSVERDFDGQVALVWKLVADRLAGLAELNKHFIYGSRGALGVATIASQHRELADEMDVLAEMLRKLEEGVEG